MVCICGVGHIAWASALLNLTTVGNARASTSGMSNWVQTLTLFFMSYMKHNLKRFAGEAQDRP